MANTVSTARKHCVGQVDALAMVVVFRGGLFVLLSGEISFAIGLIAIYTKLEKLINHVSNNYAFIFEKVVYSAHQIFKGLCRAKR